MGSILNPYVSFDGNAREAMEFYQSVLGGELKVMTFGESGMPGPGSDKVMHAQLTSAEGYTIMASDMPPGMPHKGYEGFTLSVQGKSVEEGKRLFDALSAGGKVTMPFAETFWAKGFGMLVDKFGVPWMVNCEH